MKKRNWFDIKNVDSTLTDIYFYGFIGDYGWMADEEDVSAADFANEFNKIKSPNLSLRIDSPGGVIHEGIAIYNIIKQSNKKVTAYVDGMAASIASIIALAADHVFIPENALFMIHNPLSGIMGESEDMRKQADLLDKLKGQLVNIYIEKTGKSEKEIGDMMNAETWLTGQEAYDFGFADETTEALSAVAVHDLSKYNFKNTAKYTRLLKQADININSPKLKTEVSYMDLATLKEKHPDTYQAAFAEGEAAGNTKGKEAGIEEGKALGSKAGAEAENKRIESINALAVEGSEEIINAALKNPEATPEQVAISIVTNAKKQKTALAANNAAEGGELAGQAAGIDGGTEVTDDENDAAKRKNASEKMANAMNKRAGTAK